MDMQKIYSKFESGDSLTNKELQLLNDSFVKLSNTISILGATAIPYARFIYTIESKTSEFRRARNMAPSGYSNPDYQTKTSMHSRMAYRKIFYAVNEPCVNIDDALGQFPLVDVNNLISVLDEIEEVIKEYSLLFAPLVAYVAASKTKLAQYTAIEVKIAE